MNLRTLLFLARKDLFKDWRVLLLVLLAVGSGALAIVPLNGMLTGFTAGLTATTIDIAVGHAISAA
jgi:predicted exporter